MPIRLNRADRPKVCKISVKTTGWRSSGFTLVELLLGLAISAMLLAAIAAAVHASLMSYQENEKSASLTQTARAVLNRLVNDVRTAQAVTSTETSLTIIPPDNGSGITEVQYDFTGGQLLYRVTQNGTQSSHVLVDGPAGAGANEAQISAFTVLREVGLDWQGFECTKSATVRLVLSIDGDTFGVTATAAPRRNQTY